jgi:ABC-type branched-subunit amino acid transport system ATPase component
MFASLSGFVTPSTFAFSQSILFVLVVIIGGAGTVTGPLVGAAVVVLLPELLAGLAEYRLLFFGTLLLLVLWIAPEGIVGEVGRWFGRRRAPLPASDAGPVERAATAGGALAVEGLTIAFGGVRAVTGFAFDAQPGAITSLIGPNGAGKTTVLNMLGGFYRPDAGTIRLGAEAIQGRPAYAIARAGIARTYQTSQLFGSMSVLDNLTIAQARGRFGSPFAAPSAEAIARARSLAAYVGYRGDLARRAADLPHVDRRVVEIARALATAPAVLLLDEPAAGLSRADKRALAALLRRIADRGLAVVLVEHDMSLVMGISDRVTVIDAGVRIAAGSPSDVQQDAAVKKAYLGEEAGRPSAHRTAEAALGGTLLEVGKLSAGYGAEPVLRSVELRVRDREMVAVLGANGAGKSTLMRALAGLHRPVEGGISLDGAALERLPAHKVVARGVALVPEGRQVFPELSVLDNIRLGAYLRRDAIDAEVEAMLERFPRLRARLDQRAGLLSGGEQQMLALARGLMARPRLLLLDEPSLGLAPAVINDLFAALDRLRSEAATILLVDQMAGLALTLADRAYVIEGGQIVAAGGAAEIAAQGALERAYLGAGAQAG